MFVGYWLLPLAHTGNRKLLILNMHVICVSWQHTTIYNNGTTPFGGSCGHFFILTCSYCNYLWELPTLVKLIIVQPFSVHLICT